MAERPSKSRVPALRIVLLVATAVLFAARFSLGVRSRGTEALWDLLLALTVVGVPAVFLLTVPAGKARKAAEALRAARPDAVVVETYWGAGYTDFFFRPGPLTRQARGRSGRVLVVADRRGLELVRPQGAFSFGMIPWSLVKDVRLEDLSGPLASRPKLVFEIQGSSTPFQDRFELLPTDKDERAHAGQSLDAILAKRPSTHS
ncbi:MULTISPECIES: hypothetical protein [Arthrobacter]|uniref:Uncharacterized protein n=1 Tax=Arthrobacter terricola TaxID=2547396 RepID=A0A4R5K920_9MICC|nr:MULTISPECIES: hypothetical protein [Arthrobacter]MBT8162962.1 hypothetical protein [Arthrobacter sp. GN70]TDF91633.1 hypothetical protein E1809_20125 [Arthrobacter terricola]